MSIPQCTSGNSCEKLRGGNVVNTPYCLENYYLHIHIYKIITGCVAYCNVTTLGIAQDKKQKPALLQPDT